MTTRTLLVVGGSRSAAEAGAPRADFDVLAAELQADVLSQQTDGLIRTRSRGGFALARHAARRAMDYDNVYCDSEHVALPLAWFLRRSSRPRLSTIAHYLTPLKKRAFIRAARLDRRIDAVAVHSEAQAVRARTLGFGDRVHVIPYQVDADYWYPAEAPPKHILSVGREFRDYGTLARAVRGLPTTVLVAQGSPWSTRRSTLSNNRAPENLVVKSLASPELRDAYAEAHFVVVPLVDVDFQAGIITILEAMSMGKAVIVSRTRGQRGTVTGPLLQVEGFGDVGENTWRAATGLYVPPGDEGQLRSAISYLLDHPHVAKRMGREGREHVEAAFTVEHFARRLASLIDSGVSSPLELVPA